jgi:hypothetical protein
MIMRGLLVLTCASLAGLMAGCNEYSREPVVARTSSISSVGDANDSIKALIVHGDLPLHVADAAAWQRMLKDYRIEASLRNNKALRKSDFSGKDLIIVGTSRTEQTSYLESPPRPGISIISKEGSEAVEMLSESGLPIIGIGESGQFIFFLSNAPVYADFGGCPSSGVHEFVLTEDAKKYLKDPFPIDETRWTIENREKDAGTYRFPLLIAECILEDANRPYLPPIIRVQKYVSWWATQTPQEMSEATKRLFANIAFALAKEEGARSDADRSAALQEQNYRNSLEYYEVFCLDKVDGRGLGGEVFWSDSASPEEVRHRVYLRRLKECTRDWCAELPDTIVSQEDRDEVDKIVRPFYPEPGVPKKGQSIRMDFYGGNRCRVDIMYYDHGPLAAAGYDCYLVKYQGKWVVMSQGRWIS